MRNLGLCILLLVAVLTVYACSTGNQGTVPNPTEDNRETFSVEVVGGLGTFTPEVVVEETSSGVAVTVSATKAEDLASANFNLHYDSKLYSPEKVVISDLLGIEDQVLCLSVLEGDGHVAVGVAQIANHGGNPVNGSGNLATIYFSNGAATTLKASSASPGGDKNAVTDLVITEQTMDSVTLRWTEVNIGDYDNNSEVNIADITPIAILYGQDNSTPQGKLVDGDGNGEINLADITPIAVNYGNKCNGYTVYGDGSGTDNVGSGCTCVRSAFFVDGKTPVVYTFVGDYDPILPAIFTVRPVATFEATSPGTLSNVAEAIIEAGAPEPPTNVVATSGEAVGNGKIVLSWTKSTYTNQYDVAAYEIERSDAGSGVWAPLTEVGGGFDSFTDLGLDDQGYEYKVRARDFTDLTSDWSDTASAAPWFLPPPDPPTNLTAIPHTSQSAAVYLEWDAPATGTVRRYIIFSQEQGGTGFEQVGVTAYASTKNFTHSGLVPLSTYEYYVVTVDDWYLESGPSGIATSQSSEEGAIVITSLTTDKTTHFKDGGDSVGSNITVVADDTPDSVDWTCTVGTVTGSGTTVSYSPPGGSSAGVVTITCTVHKGSGQDSRDIKMYLTSATIQTIYAGRNGSNIPMGTPSGSGYKSDFDYGTQEYVQTLADGHGVVTGSGNLHNQTEGKVALLGYWELWCGPCKAEFPELDNFAEHFLDHDFLFVACSSDTSPSYNAAAIDAWFIGNNIDFCHNYHGGKPGFWASMGADGYIPLNVIVDRDGYVRWVGGNAESKAPLIQELTGGPAY